MKKPVKKSSIFWLWVHATPFWAILTSFNGPFELRKKKKTLVTPYGSNSGVSFLKPVDPVLAVVAAQALAVDCLNHRS
jgi:hypothetical protein